MLVYGDRSELADPAARLAAIAARLRAIASMPSGIERHAILVAALIEAGQLQQGVADKGFTAPDLERFVDKLAGCVLRSVDTRHDEFGELPSVPDELLSGSIRLRVPEGFAFYSLYPEAYVRSARELRLAGRPRVIGIRSIGTTLGAIVAKAIGAPPAITVRPVGDPYAREVELPPVIIDAAAHYVIVDEGPGLSGSSFGAVADWLEARGVPTDRIAFLPSHSGDPGPQSSNAHRKRWHRAQRVAAKFDWSFLEERLGPLREFAGGGAWQRTKFLARRNGVDLLVKFAGLGSIGERKLGMARALHAAALVPEPVELIHGFLVERWIGEARPLRRDERPLEGFARYIGARARLFPATPWSGASLEELIAMCRRNVDLALGTAALRCLDRFDAVRLAGEVNRVCTDNKMQPGEWQVDGNGRLLKTDALDHHQAHDLVGCQAIEWDLAGLAEEFALGPSEVSRVAAAAGLELDAELLSFYRVAYAAFWLGQSTLVGDAHVAARYRCSLEHLLHQNS